MDWRWLSWLLTALLVGWLARGYYEAPTTEAQIKREAQRRAQEAAHEMRVLTETYRLLTPDPPRTEGASSAVRSPR